MMYVVRGEAANHGITDVSVLLSHLASYLDRGSSSSSNSKHEPSSLEQLVSAYEVEMVARTRPAVLASRRACLDAHDYKRITEKSPLVSRRAIVIEEEQQQQQQERENLS